MTEGWVCPVCGRGLAPWVTECPCYKEPPVIKFDGDIEALKKQLERATTEVQLIGKDYEIN